MSCEHCCFSCTAKGKDMSLETFRKALGLAANYGEFVTLGGGEPTVHPLFEQFLLEAIADGNGDNVFVITNGKDTRRAMMLVNLIRHKIIGGDLSQDPWHEEIDEGVVEAFSKLGSSFGRYTHIRDVSQSVSGVAAHGRAKKNNIGKSDHCTCEDLFVTPSGIIKQCGCLHSPIIGNVDNGFDTPCSGVCYRSEEYKKEIAA